MRATAGLVRRPRDAIGLTSSRHDLTGNENVSTVVSTNNTAVTVVAVDSREALAPPSRRLYRPALRASGSSAEEWVVERNHGFMIPWCRDGGGNPGQRDRQDQSSGNEGPSSHEHDYQRSHHGNDAVSW